MGPSGGHHTALLVGCLIHHHVSLQCHARASRFSMGRSVGTRPEYFFNFLPKGGTSTHTILGLGIECDIVIQGLNNFRLTTIGIYIYKDRLEPTSVYPFEKRLRRDKQLNMVSKSDYFHIGILPKIHDNHGFLVKSHCENSHFCLPCSTACNFFVSQKYFCLKSILF